MPITLHLPNSRGAIDRLVLLVGAILVLAGLAAAPASASVSEWEDTYSLNPSEAEGSEQSLDAVHCIEVSLCMAVGSYANGEGSGELAEVWNGKGEWSYAPLSTGAQLNDVACVSVNGCFVVGGKEGQVWAHGWHKETGWLSFPASVPSGASSSELRGIGCSPLEAWITCVAVGSKTVTGVETALAMSPVGGEWVPQTLPSEGESSVLNDVSCNSSSSCVAVGYFVEAGEKRPLAMHWNGGAWSVIPVPNASAEGTDTYLEDVSCKSVGILLSARCVAVGSNEGGSPQVGVGMYWDGEEWSEVAPQEPPGLEGGDFSLHGVSCLSVSECYAAGEFSPTFGETQVLVEEWDGSEWTYTAVSNPENYSSVLKGISCIAAAETCMAVGTTEASWVDTLALYGR